MTEAVVVPYDIANQSVTTSSTTTPGCGSATGARSSHALNAFANESLHRRAGGGGGQGPVPVPPVAARASSRASANVLKLAAEKAGWGKPLPAGRARGIALMEGYDTYMAQVAEVSAWKAARSRCIASRWRPTSGRMVNPEHRRSSRSSATSSSACGAALYGEITLKDGRVQQSNFDNYQMLRMPETPKIEMHIVESTEKPGGIGEPGMALFSPALANAVYALTGKRLRKMPFSLA